MSQQDEQLVIFAGPTNHVEGSILATCTKCFSQVYLSPFSQRMQSERACVVVCIGCAPLLITDETEYLNHPAQAAEIGVTEEELSKLNMEARRVLRGKNYTPT